MYMTRFIPSSLARFGLVGSLVAGLAGCTGSMGNPQGNSGSGGNNNSSSGSGGNKSGSGGSKASGSGGSNGSGTGGDPGGGGTISCAPGIPATTQLRRMLNREDVATVRDLLGLTTGYAGAMNGAPSAMLYADFDGPMVPDAWRIYQDVGAAIA